MNDVTLGRRQGCGEHSPVPGRGNWAGRGCSQKDAAGGSWSTECGEGVQHEAEA